MNTLTKSHKLNHYIEAAQALGLDVQIEDNSDDLGQSYHVVIQRPQVEMTNLLAFVHNMEMLTIHAHRYIGDGKPRTFRLDARHWSANTNNRHITLRSLDFHLNRFYRDMLEYPKLTA